MKGRDRRNFLTGTTAHFADQLAAKRLALDGADGLRLLITAGPRLMHGFWPVFVDNWPATATEEWILLNKQDLLRELNERIARGYAIQVVAADAYPPSLGINSESLTRHYQDKSKPFPVSMILLCMICNHRPWKG
jgi:hypothetical protein